MNVSLVKDVERAVANGDPAARMSMLRRVTDLFVDNSERLGDAELSAFDGVILRLSQSVESAARASLSETLAAIATAPPSVVRDLAYDRDVAVASPVLSRSSQLAESDILRIAEGHGQGHLYALSQRRSLSEQVTDVLIERGDRAVVRSVAGNEGARISQLGFGTLTARAEADEELQGVLQLRRDVPPEHMARIVAIVEARVARKLGEEFGAKAAAHAVSGATRGLSSGALSMEEAVVTVDARLAKSGRDAPEEIEIARWLKGGEVMEALVGLARAASVPPDMAVRAYQTVNSDPLLFLVRSVRFGWPTFKLFRQSRRTQPETAEEARAAFEAFESLSVATAQRVVRFTAAREQLQKAG